MTEGYCHNCPDHEACSTGYPCDVVLWVQRESENRILAESGVVFHTDEASEVISGRVTEAILGRTEAPELIVEDD